MKSGKSRKKKSVSRQGASTAGRRSDGELDTFHAKQPGQLFWLAPVLIFTISTLVYWQTLHYDYVLDDTIVIVENRYVDAGMAGLWDIFTTESFQGYFGEQKNLLVGARYRPMSIAFFALETSVFGKNPLVGHLGNLLFYGLSVVLLYLLFCRLSIQRDWRSPFWVSVPFWAALLYGLHPLHTEVVANIKGRDELFAFIGMVAALWSAFSWYDKRGSWRLGLVFLCSFAGMLSKENALALVPLVPLSLYFFRSWDKRRVWLASMPVALAALAYLVIRRIVIGFWLDPGVEITDIMNNPFYGLSSAERFATVFYTLLLYLKLLIFPHPLTHDYYPYQIPVMNWGQMWPWLGFLFMVLLTFYALRGLRRKGVMAYGVWFYLLTLFLVSNLLFTVGTFMNERFVFIPSAGFTLALSYFLLYYSREKWRLPTRYAVVILSIISVGYAVKGFSRVPAWENTMSLNSASIRVSANSARANLFMGTALFNEFRATPERDERRRLLGEAGVYINRAVEIHPDYGPAWNMVAGVAAEEYGFDRDLDKLLDRFHTVISHRPQLKYVVEYLEYLNKSASNRDKLVPFYKRVGYDLLAREKGNYKMAIHYLNYAYQLDPSNVLIIEAIGRTYRLAGDEQQARKFLSRIGQE